MGIKYLDKRKIVKKMKFSAALLATVAVAEKKVPPRHPLQRLNKLTMFSEELMNDWFGALPSKDNWIAKFATNAGRMARNFERGNQRCGFYDENQMPHGGPEEEESNDNSDDGYDNDDGYRRQRATDDDLRYDTNDPCVGTKQITTGFSKWAVRYIGNCSGQKNNKFQVNRMDRWNNRLRGFLGCQ